MVADSRPGTGAAAAPEPGPSRLEARYLASLPPLYYGLGALWIGTGLLPLAGALGVRLELPATLSESVLDALFELARGAFFFALGLGFIAYGAALVAAGAALARRRRLRFCRLVGWLACLFFPFGTLAGVMTILLLRRPRIRASFHTVSKHAV